MHVNDGLPFHEGGDYEAILTKNKTGEIVAYSPLSKPLHSFSSKQQLPCHSLVHLQFLQPIRHV